MKKLVSVLTALALSLSMCSALAEISALPAYTYQGEDPIMAAVVKYMQETDFGFEPADGGVLIPTPIILRTEVNEDGDKAAVYGNFWIFTYTLEGRTLMTGPCGENPGVIRLEKKDDIWRAADAEFAEEGTYNESIVRFANGDKQLENDYRRTTDNSDESFLPQYQRNVLVEYVNANSLDITAYQDYGQDPVDLVK